MLLRTSETTYGRFLADAETFWPMQVLPPDPEAVLVVEALHCDVRVVLRNLTLANAIRRLVPATLLVLVGADPVWPDAWRMSYDTERATGFARAFGADEIIDLHAVVEERMAGGDVKPGDVPADVLEDIVVATHCRLQRMPFITDEVRNSNGYAYARARAAVYSRFYDEIVHGDRRVVAVVSSHVDYDQWGLLVESAMRGGVPVMHTQQTGALKTYAWFPETGGADQSFRSRLTPQVGEFFEERIWSRRDDLRPAAERVAWRARTNLGRPSWWRAGADADVELHNPVERRQVRMHAARRFGFDPDKPVVVAFNHCVSDALGTNQEIFPSLADWFTATAAYARTETRVNWLFLDHPSQDRYDESGFFDALAAEHAGVPHMVFDRSTALSKSVQWSLADLGLTVRGSVSNEMPAYGIPVLMAGWSEWSACGLAEVATDQDDYWARLRRAVAGLLAGESLITAEQVERARLWLWLYRSGTDVVSGLVPAWDTWPPEHLLRAVQVYMRQVETDDEPLFAAVERMWTNRLPLLTRSALAAGTVVPEGTEPVTAPAPHARTEATLPSVALPAPARPSTSPISAVASE
jgi:hypothetical protein